MWSGAIGTRRGESPDRDQAEILGVRIDRLNLDSTLKRIDDLIDAGTPCQHVAVNAAKIVAMRSDECLARIVGRCGLVSADGQALVWASRLLDDPLPERVAGIDLMTALLGRAVARRYRVYLLGARPQVVERVVAICGERYAGLEIGGWHHGYFPDAETPAIVDAIRASRSQILFVAMGTPKKEYWLDEHLGDLGVPFCMGVGGSFDVLSGEIRRAPGWAQRHGLEWAFRLVQEPRRMVGRYARTNTVFMGLLAAEWLRRRAGERRRRT